MLRAAFPLLLLSLDLAPGSPRSHDEGCSQSLTHSTPEPSYALALRHTAPTTSTAEGKHWPPWGQAGEGGEECWATQKSLKLGGRAPTLLLGVEGVRSQSTEPLVPTHEWAKGREDNSLINWIIEPESQAFK